MNGVAPQFSERRYGDVLWASSRAVEKRGEDCRFHLSIGRSGSEVRVGAISPVAMADPLTGSSPWNESLLIKITETKLEIGGTSFVKLANAASLEREKSNRI